MWVQCVSESWTNVPHPGGTGSGESSLSGPSLLEEEVPENLGREWRVLHSFEIPGLRFPTDTTPPNQRRCPGRTYTNYRIFRGFTYVGTMRLLVLPP